MHRERELMSTRLFVPLVVSVLAAVTATADLQTKAESSDYQATSSYAEVVAFCQALAEESPRVVHTNFGQSGEKRDLPLLILSDEGTTEPNDRLTVLCLGNIHAGEVCGKEALLMLARDLARAEKPELLDNINLLIAPSTTLMAMRRWRMTTAPAKTVPRMAWENGTTANISISIETM